MNSSTRATSRKPVSRLAFAVALAGGAALGMTTLATPASAQANDQEQQAQAANYSEGFIAAYTPLETQYNAAGTAPETLKAAVPGLIAAAQTPDDRSAAGNMVYGIGTKTNDPAMQLQGLKLMIESGRLAADRVGEINLAAGQLSYQVGDYAAARTYLETALAAGETRNDPAALIAESYFQQDMNAEGLAYLGRLIEQREAAGQPIDENWIKRGISIAYNADMPNEAFDYATLLVTHYPSPTAWGDSIAILRNFNAYDDQAMLDLMRLAERTDSLRDARDYADYVEAADPRRLPGEVHSVLQQGVAAGTINANDAFVQEAMTMAEQRIDADRADLAQLESEARSAGTDAMTASVAGDVFLSYGQAAKAEELYELALEKPGADTPRVLTRLGIAQADQGKSEEAKATFAQVQGDRQAIARLWSLYADTAAAS